MLNYKRHDYNDLWEILQIVIILTMSCIFEWKILNMPYKFVCLFTFLKFTENCNKITLTVKIILKLIAIKFIETTVFPRL